MTTSTETLQAWSKRCEVDAAAEMTVAVVPITITKLVNEIVKLRSHKGMLLDGVDEVISELAQHGDEINLPWIDQRLRRSKSSLRRLK